MGLQDWLTGQGDYLDQSNAALRASQLGTERGQEITQEALDRSIGFQQPYIDFGRESLTPLRQASEVGEYEAIMPEQLTEQQALSSPLYQLQKKRQEEDINKWAASRGGFGDTATVERLSEAGQILRATEIERQIQQGRLDRDERRGERAYESSLADKRFNNLLNLTDIGRTAANTASGATTAAGGQMAALESYGAGREAEIYNDRANLAMDYSPLNLGSDIIGSGLIPGAIGAGEAIFDAGKGIYDWATGAEDVAKGVGTAKAVEGAKDIAKGAGLLGGVSAAPSIMGGLGGLDALGALDTVGTGLGSAMEGYQLGNLGAEIGFQGGLAEGLGSQVAPEVANVAAQELGKTAGGEALKQSTGGFLAAITGSAAGALDAAALGTALGGVGAVLALDALFGGHATADLGLDFANWHGAGKEEQTKGYWDQIAAYQKQFGISQAQAIEMFNAQKLGDSADIVGGTGGALLAGIDLGAGGAFGGYATPYV